MATSRDQRLAMVNARLAQSPEWRALAPRLAQLTSGGGSSDQAVAIYAEVQQVLASLGLTREDVNDLKFDPSTGLYQEESFMERNPWMGGAIAAGTAVGGGYGINAAMGGGAGAGAAGGAGATGGAAGAGGGAGAAGGAATGGGILSTLGQWGERLRPLASVLSEGSGGMADDRRADDANNARAIAENNRALADVARFNLEAPGLRTNQAARGEILATMQDAPRTGDARVDKWAGGGLRPSAIGPQGRQAGSELSRQALLALMNNSDRITPQPIPQSNPSAGENLMGGAGIGLNLFDTLSGFWRRPTQGASSSFTQPVSSNVRMPTF